MQAYGGICIWKKNFGKHIHMHMDMEKNFGRHMHMPFNCFFTTLSDKV